MNKRRLGRGLSALIPDQREGLADSFEEGKIVEIPVGKIKPNPAQPRKDFDEDKLKEMAETIKAYGVIQPVIVHRAEDKDIYILVAGERRWRAARLAGLASIPALVKDYSGEQLTEIALVENLQREDLNPIEEAYAYKRLIEEFGLTQEDLAKKLGRSRSAIANSLRLLSLNEDVQKLIIEGSLTPGQVRPLLALENGDYQKELAKKIIENNLSARKVEEMVQKMKKAKRNKLPKRADDSLRELFYKEVEDKMRQVYGTKVTISWGAKEGKIEISFYGDEDLERLLKLLLKENES